MGFDININHRVEFFLSTSTLSQLAAILSGSLLCTADPTQETSVISDTQPTSDLAPRCDSTPQTPTIPEKTEKLRGIYEKISTVASEKKPVSPKAKITKEYIAPKKGYTTPDAVIVPGYKSTTFLESVDGVVCMEYYSNHLNIPWIDLYTLYEETAPSEFEGNASSLKERVSSRLAGRVPPMDSTRRVIMATQFLKAMYTHGIRVGAAKQIYEKQAGKKVVQPDPSILEDADSPMLAKYYSTRPDDNSGKVEGTLEV
ncbi:hypothetical protein [Methanosarcina sp.]|uniref:hypothetical protein n=1 Tax=Methanosarcina sp. TaxID=2213 RepID=UPI003BB53B3C